MTDKTNDLLIDLVNEARAIHRTLQAANAVKPTTPPTPDPAPDPEPRPGYDDLPDDTPVPGWVVDSEGDLLRKDKYCFREWYSGLRRWSEGPYWGPEQVDVQRAATVADLRCAGVPTSEWPEGLAAPAPAPDPPVDWQARAEKAEAEREQTEVERLTADLTVATYELAKAESELRARELHHFEAEKKAAEAEVDRDDAVEALREASAFSARMARELAPSEDYGRGRIDAHRFLVRQIDDLARQRGIDLGGEE